MKETLIVLCFSCFIASLKAQERVCGNAAFMKESSSERAEFDKKIAEHLEKYPTLSRSEVTIPVVFHIIWNIPSENISDALVVSQIEALNKDYGANNENFSKIPIEFQSVVGNPAIRFCLAAYSPDGKITTGITRKQTDIQEIGLSESLYDTRKGGTTAWDTEKYLNIWVANTGKIIAGLGSYPTQTAAEKTGVVIHPKYFGINGHPKYGLGRVGTHEVGHYLGLKHCWADDTDCATDDGVADTPPQRKAYFGCPSYPQMGCSPSEMFMNYMDYVDDPCMIMFSRGQKERMYATLETYRQGLVNGNISCLNISKEETTLVGIFPNPSTDLFTFKFKVAPKKLLTNKIYTFLGQLIASEKILVSQELVVDMSYFPAGMYFISLENKTYKVVKI